MRSLTKPFRHMPVLRPLSLSVMGTGALLVTAEAVGTSSRLEEWMRLAALGQAETSAVFCQNPEKAYTFERDPRLVEMLSAARTRVEERLQQEGVAVHLAVHPREVIVCDPLPVVISSAGTTSNVLGTVLDYPGMENVEGHQSFGGLVVMNEGMVEDGERISDQNVTLDHELVHLTQPKKVTWMHEAEASILSQQNNEAGVAAQYLLSVMWWRLLESQLKEDEGRLSQLFRSEGSGEARMQELLDEAVASLEVEDDEKRKVKALLRGNSMHDVWVGFSKFLQEESKNQEAWKEVLTRGLPMSLEEKDSFWKEVMNAEGSQNAASPEKIEAIRDRAGKELELKLAVSNASLAFMKWKILALKSGPVGRMLIVLSVLGELLAGMSRILSPLKKKS